MQKSEKFKVSICYKKTHFGPLSVQKPQCKIFPKNIIRVNFKALCCCNFMQKIEKFHVLTIVVTWKTSFWAPFDPKNSKHSYFQKIISATFKYLRCRNFRKVPCIGIWQHLKNFILGPFLPKNFKTMLFPTKSLLSILSLHATVTSCQQSEKFHALTFDNTWKTSWPFRAAYGPKTSEKHFSL